MQPAGPPTVQLGRAPLAVGLVLMIVAFLIVLYGVVGITQSGCTDAPSGFDSQSCWGTMPGYLVVEGAILFVVGTVVSVVAAARARPT